MLEKVERGNGDKDFRLLILALKDFDSEKEMTFFVSNPIQSLSSS